MSLKLNSRGFALPTVLIASIVMLVVLLSGLVAASSVNTALRQQYYDRLTKEAVESGVTMADVCLAKSNQIVTWSDANPLRPNTDCNGTVITAAPVPSQYILDTPNFKTTFSVSAPVDLNGAMRVNVTATLYKYRTSGAGTPQTQTDTRSSLVGGQNSFTSVAFGYSYQYTANEGAQFLVILPTGEVKGVGRNNNARLGYYCAGCDNQTSPVTFGLPGTEKGIAAYSSFLSLGTNVYVVTASGKVYGAGDNNYGQLGGAGGGNGSPTPVQFGTIGNTGQPKAKFVSTLGYSAFVMADDGSIYAAGDCTYLQLGTGCSSGSTASPTRVALPTVTSDPNTVPETDPGWVQATNMAVDRFNGYVRMKGGYVYGWGYNDYGQLGNSTTTNSTTPIRLQTTPSSASPTFTQISFNGQAVYLLDNTGMVWAAGDNTYGEQMGAGTRLQNQSGSYCLDSNNPSGGGFGVVSCTNSSTTQVFEFWPDKTWRMRASSSSYLPTDSMNCVTDQISSSTLVLASCTPGNTAQKWTLTDRNIISDSTGRCVQPTKTGPSTPIFLSTCGGPLTNWLTRSNTQLRPVPKPPGNPTITRITTDNGSVHLLDSNGNVWAAGANSRGQLGLGVTPITAGKLDNLVLRQAVFPGGSVVKDIYNAEIDPNGLSTGINSGAYNNTYYILSDGSVWGAGANNFGQLGIGTTSDYSSTPVKMTTLPAGVQAKYVQTGYGTTVVLTIGGKIYTVGNNSNGQLGDGTTTSSSTAKANVYTNQRTTIRY